MAEKRGNVLSVRLSDTEWRVVSRAAAEAEVSIADLTRAALLTRALPQLVRAGADDSDLDA